MRKYLLNMHVDKKNTVLHKVSEFTYDIIFNNDLYSFCHAISNNVNLIECTIKVLCKFF